MVLTLGSVYVIFNLPSIYEFINDTRLEKLLDPLHEPFPTLIVVQGGQLGLCPWILESAGFYGLPPLAFEGTHRDNSVKNNLLIEYWLLRISLPCVVQLFIFINIK